MQKLFRLEILLALYCGLSSILVLGTTFIFVPSKKDLVQHVTNRSVIKDALLGEPPEIDFENCPMPKDNGNCDIKDYFGSNNLPVIEEKIAIKESSLIGMKDI